MTAAGVPVPREQRELVTPEGVDLRLRIGSGGERAAAFLLDCLFLVLAVVALLIGLGFLAGALDQLGEPMVKRHLGDAMMVVLFLGAFGLRYAYFTLFELSNRAATPGKRIMGMRVAARDGGRLTAEAVFARNAMREIEIFLPLTFLMAAGAGAASPVGGWIVLLGLLWTGGFALFPLFNRDRLRVGDFVAGTWVVKAPKQRLSIDLLDAPERADGVVFTQPQVGAYGIRELHVLEDVLRRKDKKTMAAVATRIRGKIDWRAADGETDVAFLAAYYAALRARLETQLLFGRRRKDKFDVG